MLETLRGQRKTFFITFRKLVDSCHKNRFGFFWLSFREFCSEKRKKSSLCHSNHPGVLAYLCWLLCHALITRLVNWVVKTLPDEWTSKKPLWYLTSPWKHLCMYTSDVSVVCRLAYSGVGQWRRLFFLKHLAGIFSWHPLMSWLLSLQSGLVCPPSREYHGDDFQQQLYSSGTLILVRSLKNPTF